ncbi:MAG: discoidin domain-containing protein, partial [Terrimonas sp.]|nr:discoidin domain-containing protein [Terrimonas sp.]
MTSPQNQPQKLVDGKNSGVSYDVRMETTTATVNARGSGRQVYQFNMNIPVKLTKILLGYTGIYSHFNNDTKLILRGSNDGISWTNLSAEVTYDATINSNSATETSTIYPYPATTQYATSANIFTVTQNAAKYQYYDIFWSNGGGINNTGYANEVYFDVASDYIPSEHPKITCTNDTDGDGVLNHQDLDSDGDGCPDAKETGISVSLTSASATNLAGATIASGTATTTLSNAIVAGAASTFGANGFFDGLETSGNGIFNGTYNYSLAINKSISTCTESDGDGVPDVLDLDDDNDGVLDIVECPTPGKQPLLARFDIAEGASKTATLNGFPEELWIDIWTLDNNFSLHVNGTDITTVSELNFAPMGSATVYPVPHSDVVRANSTPIYPLGSVWTYPNTAQYPLIRVKISNTGYAKIYGYDFVNGAGNYVELVLVNAAYQKVPINLNGNNTVVIDQNNSFSPSYLNAELNTFDSAGFCDTDRDGVENRLDLDSDGDGCSDAYEAKTTTSTTTDFQYASNLSYGTNGFLNTLETTADNGIYSSYYPYDFAIDATVKACLDSDTDGVPDVNDLDDDNDGILDAIESPNCFFTLSELAKPAAVSSDLLPYDGTATYALNNSIDASASTFSAFKSGQFLAGKEILKYTANGLIDITSLTLNLDFRAISTDAASTFRFQGSVDNVLWDNLNTAPVSSLTFTPPATLVLTNTLQVGKKYKYFRLYGVAGTSNFGGVANATFNLASSNRSSANPKLTCTTDTDGDGILNHLDLDSDGDGCPDAKEASIAGTLNSGAVKNGSNGSVTSTTTLANSIAAGSYGANGFADALETIAESGIYSGIYTNENVLSAFFNACTDSDTDGVTDLVDIDDDNDGVLDAVESPSCFYTPEELVQPIAISTELAPYSTYVIGNSIDGSSTTISAFAPSVSWVNKELFKLTALKSIPISGLSLDLSTWALSNGTSNTFKLQGSNDNSAWTDLSSAVSSTATTGIFTLTNSIAPNTKYLYYRVIGVAGTSYYGGVTEIKFVISSSFNASQYTKPACTTGTSDGDTIPNHLDLDSDGDGCSDAFEAGTTTSTATNFAFTGSDFGANGFKDELEKTSPESNLYKGVYTYDYATNAAYNYCTDSDGDGVPDLIDLDNDNDGILDAIESPT